MPAPRSKKSPATAEVRPVNKARKPARPAAAAERTAKKASAPTTKPRTRTAQPRTTKPPAAESRFARPPSTLVFWALLVVIPAVALTVFLLVRGDDSEQQIRPGVAAAISPEELASFARSREAPVYWAGRVPGRQLELTTTRAGTFARYLPQSAPAGNSRRALTIATYPLSNAYAIATRRGGGPRMAKRTLPAGGIAVWSRAQPTSIYLAFQGVPHLVEVYAPTRGEARRFALSGRIRPVS